jgi:hypothetical protein
MILCFAGPERGEDPDGANVLRLIQIRLTPSSLEKSRQPVKPIRRNPESPLQVPKNAVNFIRPYNETLSVVAMCVCIQIIRPLESRAET